MLLYQAFVLLILATSSVTSHNERVHHVRKGRRRGPGNYHYPYGDSFVLEVDGNGYTFYPRRKRPSSSWYDGIPGEHQNYPSSWFSSPNSGWSSHRHTCDSYNVDSITLDEALNWVQHIMSRGHKLPIPVTCSTIFNPSASSNDRFQFCRTPENKKGHCRYIQHCLRREMFRNYQTFYNHVCIIKGHYVGVCCPDSHFEDPTNTIQPATSLLPTTLSMTSSSTSVPPTTLSMTSSSTSVPPTTLSMTSSSTSVPPSIPLTTHSSTSPPPTTFSTKHSSTSPPPTTSSTKPSSTSPTPTTSSTKHSSTSPPPTTSSTKPSSTSPPPTTSSTTSSPTSETSSESPFDKECGLTFKKRIVGGIRADPNDWRWMAALLRGTVDFSGQFCGGVLINKQYVLTAAHCADGFQLRYEQPAIQQGRSKHHGSQE
ncbi:uncharacterized protein LOC143242363 [Tachypleus tridentatus]|uniref:uncharacterized protein LOC143242363 n=1 Tax=Tachypleus tridentatus TaxID=6853 RepID=UPI003FD13F03